MLGSWVNRKKEPGSWLTNRQPLASIGPISQIQQPFEVEAKMPRGLRRLVHALRIKPFALCAKALHIGPHQPLLDQSHNGKERAVVRHASS
jgi:hypothetical protein